ncbi:MAG TPA: serpin family protein, partial [Methanoculleus sp.]|nr:serpin family protein [Methanoculleus sp.]
MPDAIPQTMDRNAIGLLLLAGIIALGCIAAGCTGTEEAVPADSTPPAGEGTASPDDVAESISNVTDGNNRFALDLYRQISSDPAYAGRNIFFSPYSISSALAITYEGARGTTADEIRSVLSLPADDAVRRQGFAALNAALNRGSDNYTLHIANALWAEETYRFLPDYIEAAERWYGANVTNLDFVSDAEGSRETINRWVEEKTEDRIRDLLPPGSIDPLTRLVITNAIYFKGAWAQQFDPARTTEEEFRVSPNETVAVPMMHGNAVYPYAETGTLQVLEMPYSHGNGTELSMLVLLPKGDSLTAAEEVLDAERLAGLRESFTSQNVRVFFPKFTLDASYGLTPTLAAMGMPTAFTGGDADLSGMDGTRDLFVTGIFHKAFVDVNEEGTEAAA